MQSSPISAFGVVESSVLEAAAYNHMWSGLMIYLTQLELGPSSAGSDRGNDAFQQLRTTRILPSKFHAPVLRKLQSPNGFTAALYYGGELALTNAQRNGVLR